MVIVVLITVKCFCAALFYDLLLFSALFHSFPTEFILQWESSKLKKCQTSCNIELLVFVQLKNYESFWFA